MRGYLDGMFALAVEHARDPAALVRALDEPFEHELTAEERRMREIRRIADANRAGIAAIDRGGR